MKPSIGRMVHFVQERSREHIAGVVTAVHEKDFVDLTLFLPGGRGIGHVALVPNEETANQPHSWHWPERL